MLVTESWREKLRRSGRTKKKSTSLTWDVATKLARDVYTSLFRLIPCASARSATTLLRIPHVRKTMPPGRSSTSSSSLPSAPRSGMITEKAWYVLVRKDISGSQNGCHPLNLGTPYDVNKVRFITHNPTTHAWRVIMIPVGSPNCNYTMKSCKLFE